MPAHILGVPDYFIKAEKKLPILPSGHVAFTTVVYFVIVLFGKILILICDVHILCMF